MTTIETDAVLHSLDPKFKYNINFTLNNDFPKIFLIGCGISGIPCHHAFLIKQNYKMVCLGQSVVWDSFSANTANWLGRIQKSRRTCHLRKASGDTKMREWGCAASRQKMASCLHGFENEQGRWGIHLGTGPYLAFTEWEWKGTMLLGLSQAQGGHCINARKKYFYSLEICEWYKPASLL